MIAKCLAVAFALASFSMAHAIGDSGGCNGDDPLFIEAANGNASTFEAMWNRRVETFIEKSASAPERLLTRFSENYKNAYYADIRNSRVQNICGNQINPEALLGVAASSGNIETTKYLATLGISPSAPFFSSGHQTNTVFFRCDPAPKYIKIKPTNAQRVATYSYLIDIGGKLLWRASNGDTALTRCTDTDLVQMYIRRGLVPQPEDFRYAVLLAIQMDTGSDLRRTEKPWKLIEIFLQSGTELFAHKTIDGYCKNRHNTQKMTEVCTKLEKLVEIHN